MNKAKIILTCVGLLAVIGGALAIKISGFEQANIWYIPAANPTRLTTTTTAPGGPLFSTTIPNCTLSNQVAVDFGPFVLTSTSSTHVNVTTVFTRLVSPGVVSSFTTTYPFCAQIIAQTAPAN